MGRQNKTKDGLKVGHDSIEKGCAKKTCLWNDLNDATVRIAISANVEHDHAEIWTTFGINKDTKASIEHLFVTKTSQG